MSGADIRQNIGCLRIATEEAYAPAEMFDRYRPLLAPGGSDDLGFHSLMGHYMTNTTGHPAFVRERLQDLGELRLADMDAAGINHAVLALTSPGTNILTGGDAKALATVTNEKLAEAVRSYPSRFSALAAVPLDDMSAAVAELDRAVNKLGLKGVIVNSHVRGRYLDHQSFWPLLEAAEALDVPVYLHPNTPRPDMINPFVEAGIDGAIFGFAIETSTHLLRIINSGVFDCFPKLRFIVGHLGEGLPFWLYRLDYFHAKAVASKRYQAIRPLKLTISDYFRRNIWVTTSGMPSAAAIMYTRDVLGTDHVMYAMDYPYEYEMDEVRMQDELPITQPELTSFYQNIAIQQFNLDPHALGIQEGSDGGSGEAHI